MPVTEQSQRTSGCSPRLAWIAHPDPAGELSEAIQDSRGEHPEVLWLCSVTGTEADPQVLSQSVAKLEAAGAIVCGSNAQAARLAARLVKELGKRS